MRKESRGLALLFMLALLGITVLIPLLPASESTECPYSQFMDDVEAGRILRAVITGTVLTAEGSNDTRYVVQLPADLKDVERRLLSAGVTLTYMPAAEQGDGDSLLVWLLPLVLVGGVVWFMGSGETGQAISFGESRAENYVPPVKRITMDDVAGMPEVKEELQEVIDFLKSPDRYLELGARIPKGVLLSGPPGTGKTLLARAVAGEAEVAFLSTAGSGFVEMFAGVGASRVRDLFSKARLMKPCILFIDEIDALGRHRAAGGSSGSDEREQTLNQLLVEMDGFETSDGILVIAATNRPDILDPALLRPGRFDRQIAIDLPDRRGRREILGVHAREKPLAADVDLDRIASMTAGYAGADLANLLNEAALLAARWRRPAITMDELGAAYERIAAGGPGRPRAMAAAERWRSAVHEAGHAVASHKFCQTDLITKVSIVPRGRALGFVLTEPAEEKALFGQGELIGRMATILGGRAAEEVVLAESSTGAADDLDRATGIARKMATDLGMSQELGPVVLNGEDSEHTAAVLDQATRTLVLDAYDRVRSEVLAKRSAIERVARALLEQESLSGSDLERLLQEEGPDRESTGTHQTYDVDSSTTSAL